MVLLRKRFILDGHDFSRMVEEGARQLQNNVELVNSLNVFPVPDGDTGTNMNLTLTSGAEALRKRPSEHIGKAAEALAKGLLMGARGNSGVILSQLFRGFAKQSADLASLNAVQFAAALQQGVELTYKAVAKPVEGTILTVAKEAAKHAVQIAKRTDDVNTVMREVLSAAKDALARTPEQLPVLKQVGVVDSGGQGLVLVYEGFFAALHASDKAPSVLGQPPYEALGAMPVEEHAPVKAESAVEPKRVQAKLSAEEIEFGYCTEFMIMLDAQKPAVPPFDELRFRDDLAKHGDSLLVIADEDMVKVHIHAEYPGNVMNEAQRYGNLSKIKIENMRDQHAHITQLEADEQGQQQAAIADVMSEAERIASSIARASADANHTASTQTRRGDAKTDQEAAAEAAVKKYGLAAVSAGDGIAGIFRSLQVDELIHGGQTMNPSTELIVNTINRIPAETVFVLPNNSNIIMAAQQAALLIEDKQVIVISAKTIPQGIAAVLAFSEEEDAETNAARMEQAVKGIQTALVTYAVRDSQMDGVDITMGDYIAIYEGKIVGANPDAEALCKGLLDRMASEAEIITIYSGEEADKSLTERLVQYAEAEYEDLEIEVHDGGQPVYYYIISAE